LRHRLIVLALVAIHGASRPTPNVRAAAQDGAARRASTQAPASEGAATERPTYIVVNTPADLAALVTRLSQPDYVVVSWARFRDLLERAGGAAPAGDVGDGATIRTLHVGGRLGEPTSELELTLDVDLEREGPVEVPVRLDGLVVSEAREGSTALPVAVDPQGGWIVEVRGRGTHRVRLVGKAPVTRSGDRRELALAIPEAPATRLDLRGPAGMADVRLDGAELPPARVADGEARVAARLAPRSLLTLSWRAAAPDAAPSAPILTALGEIALDVDRGLATIEAAYQLRVERGELRSLHVAKDADLDRVSVEVDGQPITPSAAGADADAVLEVPLAMPIRPDSPARLTIRARRRFAADGAARWGFRGFPIREAAAQSGLVAVGRASDVSVAATAGYGLRAIDPRIDLPASLRVRPSNELAYQFLDQPFALEVEVAASHPWVRVASRSKATVAADAVTLDAYLDYRAAKDRLRTVEIGLPDGLRLDEVGPDDVVAAAEVVETGDARAVRLRVEPKAVAEGRFRVHVRGHVVRRSSEPLAIVPFRPLDVSSWGGELVLVDPDATPLGLIEDFGDYQRIDPPAARGWPWPADPIASSGKGLWLRHGEDPRPLLLAGAAREPRPRGSIVARVTLDHEGMRVDQQCELTLTDGALRTLDLAVPETWAAAWELEGLDVARREARPHDVAGYRRVRLTLATEIADQARFRIRAREPWPSPLAPGSEARREVPLAQIPGVAIDGWTVRVGCAPGVTARPEGSGWRAVGDAAPDDGRAWSADGLDPGTPPTLLVRAEPTAELPARVVTRLWVRTTRAGDGIARVEALARVEHHDGGLMLALPIGARWVRAEVAGRLVERVEQVEAPPVYRLPMPPRSDGTPVVVGLDYVIASRGISSGAWGPRFLDTVVEQAYWEVALPATWALLGVPPGWDDQNQWYWDHYVWKRRPRLTAGQLRGWVAGAPGEAPGLGREEAELAGSTHTYLFSRTLGPAAGRPWLVARPLLVLLASGGLLLASLAALSLRRPHGAGVLVLGALGACVAAACWPDATFQVAQSALPGLALGLLAVILQRLIERRGAQSRVSRSEAVTVTHARPRLHDSALDESTVVRPRPDSTARRAGAAINGGDPAGASAP
jgi:hypothetical protein